MEYGIQNNHHISARPQTLLQSHPLPHPQPQLAAAADLYSTYYSTANPYPNSIVKQEDPLESSLYADGSVVQGAEHYLYSAYHSTTNPCTNPIVKQEDPLQSGLIYAEGSVAQGAEHYAIQSGYDGQAVSYGAYQQQQQHAASYHYVQTLAVASFQQAKRKFKIHLEEKKQNVIEGGASPDATRVCTICKKHALMAQNFTCEVCKIDCNIQKTLNPHKMSKKHKTNLQKLQEKITPKPSVASAGHNKTANLESQKKKPSGKEVLQVNKEKIVQGGAAEEAIMICNLCDNVCNSKSVYESHITGRKHLSMIKKQVAQV